MKCNEISKTNKIKPTYSDSEVKSDLQFNFGRVRGKSLPKTLRVPN